MLIGLPDGPEFVGALFGTLAVGAVAVMIGPEMRPEHLSAVVTASRSPLAITDDLERFVTAGVPRIMASDFTVGDPEGFEPYPTHRDDPAIWLFSGGTTGVPKIVVQTHRSFLNTTERYAQETLAYQADDITLAVPKLYFGYATGSNLFFPFSVGASAVLFPERPTPEVSVRQGHAAPAEHLGQRAVDGGGDGGPPRRHFPGLLVAPPRHLGGRGSTRRASPSVG